MMFKLMNFSGDDIRLDEKSVSETVNSSCRRSGVYVEGIAALDDVVSLICSEKPDSFERIYRFAPLSGIDRQDLFAELRSRYDSSFRTVGAFRLADGIWLLTEKTLKTGE